MGRVFGKGERKAQRRTSSTGTTLIKYCLFGGAKSQACSSQSHCLLIARKSLSRVGSKKKRRGKLTHKKSFVRQLPCPSIDTLVSFTFFITLPSHFLINA